MVEQLVEKNGPTSLDSFSFLKLFSGYVKVNQKMIKNYLENFSGYNHDIRDIFLAYSDLYSKLFISPNELVKVQSNYYQFLNEQFEIWNHVFLKPPNNKEHKPFVLPHSGDKRFLASEWRNYPYFDFIKQNYLLAAEYITKVLNEVELSDEKRKKLRFYTSHYLNLLSPSNFLFTNPEAISLAIKTGGKSLWKGFNNFLNDMENGRISQTDNSAFQIGENIAITRGAVIYENELIQLIQYAPLTEKVYEIPLLIIPPWINKYYIFDLQKENSFVKFLTEQDITVFIISWRNPMPGMGEITFDNYVENGVLSAIDVVQEITGINKINTLGYCLGGTLLGISASILKARQKDMINSVTFLASMIDFSNIGPIGDVIDKALVNKLERGELLKNGVMHGHDMERAFNLIRANDLIWNYVINNYLMGKSPGAIDVMYWTNDNTNLPYAMYLYYMKHLIIENKLRVKNALRICDTPIDIGKIDAPVYIIAFKEDYISPPATAFATTQLVSGPVEFILGESGHVMGVLNPPAKKKYGHFQNGQLGYGFTEWQKTSQFSGTSWWITWSEKLCKQSGNKISAPEELGSKKNPIIESAPGSYVKVKCFDCFPEIAKKENLQNEKNQNQFPTNYLFSEQKNSSAILSPKTNERQTSSAINILTPPYRPSTPLINNLNIPLIS